MPKGKIVKKGVKGAIKQAGGKAKLGAGAVAAEKAVDVIDNPYLSAAEGAIIGAAATGGSPIGALAGGLIGFVLADGERIVPVDMIAVPAYQYSMILQGKEPTFQIYIKEGELIAPVLPTDMMESQMVVSSITGNDHSGNRKKPKLNAWQKYIKNKKNHIKFKSGKNKGKLNLKAMGKQFRKGRK